MQRHAFMLLPESATPCRRGLGLMVSHSTSLDHRRFLALPYNAAWIGTSTHTRLSLRPLNGCTSSVSWDVLSGADASDLVAAFVSRPLLEYSCFAWHFSLLDLISDKVESIQKRAVRIILHGPSLLFIRSWNSQLKFTTLPSLGALLQGVCKVHPPVQPSVYVTFTSNAPFFQAIWMRNA